MSQFRLLPELLCERAQHINELARSYAADNENKEAERLYKQSLTFCERTFTSGHAQTVDTLCKFGRFYFDNLKSFEQAMELYDKAIEMCEKLYRDRGNKQTATALCYLGECYWELGELETALPLYTRALDVRIAKLGIESLITLKNMQLLGRLCHEMDEDVEAAKWLMQCRNGLDEIKMKKGQDYDPGLMSTAAKNLEKALTHDLSTIPENTEGLPPVILPPTKEEVAEEWRRKREEQLRNQY
jgi:tetratricopeptide (TPR) repeat protein